jgi:hypothetical protein
MAAAGVLRLPVSLIELGSWPRVWKKCRCQALPFRLSLVWLGVAIIGALAWAVRQYAWGTLWLDDIALSRVADAELAATIRQWWMRRSTKPFTVCVSQVPFDTNAEALGFSLDVPRRQNTRTWLAHTTPRVLARW